ncbi:MAG: sugar ABC transporter permease [Clostridia bacterium]|nr:sugar ABC transporter permease [Clostridia bacterium]
MKEIEKNTAEQSVEQSTETAQVFRKDTMLNRKQKRLIFYVLMMLVPCVQFAIFYFYVNINTFRLAFLNFDLVEGGSGYETVFVGFTNFTKAWAFFTENTAFLKNSLLLYLCNLVIVMGLALFFSYYIAKKYMLAGFFRAILYLPHIIASVVLVVLYRYIITDVYMKLVEIFTGTSEGVYGLLDPSQPVSTRLTVLIVYSLFIGFGSNVLIFTGTMSGIDNSIIESAQLDGVNVLGEFIHIYIPLIFPTFTTFVVTGMCGILTADLHLYTFFGMGGTPGIDTFGYYMYRNTVNGSLYQKSAKGLSYTELSALGLIMTCIVVPITLTTRKLLETYGPSTN